MEKYLFFDLAGAVICAIAALTLSAFGAHVEGLIIMLFAASFFLSMIYGISDFWAIYALAVMATAFSVATFIAYWFILVTAVGVSDAI